jgi:hypothetical protein
VPSILVRFTVAPRNRTATVESTRGARCTTTVRGCHSSASEDTTESGSIRERSGGQALMKQIPQTPPESDVLESPASNSTRKFSPPETGGA